MDTTIHFSNERKDRSKFIRDVLGFGDVVDVFTVDRGHAGGEELHEVTDTGVVIIHSKRSSKIITAIIARPEQIKKLYKRAGKRPPRWLLRIAYKNNMSKYNEC